MSTEQQPTEQQPTEQQPTEQLTAVVVAAPFQVSHDGVIHRPGDTAKVPKYVAEYWIGHGWVQPAPDPIPARRSHQAHRMSLPP
jgi:hypothetical protein